MNPRFLKANRHQDHGPFTEPSTYFKGIIPETKIFNTIRLKPEAISVVCLNLAPLRSDPKSKLAKVAMAKSDMAKERPWGGNTAKPIICENWGIQHRHPKGPQKNPTAGCLDDSPLETGDVFYLSNPTIREDGEKKATCHGCHGSDHLYKPIGSNWFDTSNHIFSVSPSGTPCCATKRSRLGKLH